MTVMETKGREVTTPNGTRITFQTAPKRQYWVNDVPCPSATEVLDILSKPLVKWGQNIGVAGTLSLIETGDIGRRNQDSKPIIWTQSDTGRYHEPATVENVSALLKTRFLDHEAELRAAQDRGNDVHRVFEQFLEDGTIPDPELYREEIRGYVVGLVKFLEDLKVDRRAKVYSEVKVGSSKHGYAGTFDALFKLLPCELNTTPKRKREEFTGRGLFDLKTSSGVWDSHYFQLGAYRDAAVESGYPQPDFAAVVRVTKDGLYEVKRSERTQQDFLAILNAWKVVKNK